MGARKRNAADARKAALKTQYFAKLNGCPSSPRKMRYVVDMIRGMEVDRALGVLRFSNKAAAADVEKLLRSAIANWEAKNDRKAEAGELYVSKVLAVYYIIRPHTLVTEPCLVNEFDSALPVALELVSGNGHR